MFCVAIIADIFYVLCRYYWVEENLYIRAVNAEFLYGYEYLGNTGRLVITPLTDRSEMSSYGIVVLIYICPWNATEYFIEIRAV